MLGRPLCRAGRAPAALPSTLGRTNATLRWFSAARALARAPATGGYIVGSGSNVMDVFMKVRALPLPGDKQYFADEKIVSAEVVGGVTLNHLSWAAVLGAPTALLALQGNDPYGVRLRSKLAELGVASEFVRASEEYATSVSYILSAPDGERTIIMAPASTSRLTREVMEREFSAAVSAAAMVTTEISQLPLSGVEFLLDAAAARGVPSLLDVDVTPETAVGPARLGSTDELLRCLRKASVLKLTGSAVPELLALAGRPAALATGGSGGLAGVAAELASAFGARLCVITDGARGAALALSSGGASVHVGALPGVSQVDATGAGDAFFGGVVAAVHAWGMPASPADLQRVGRVASAAGAACVEVVGALPVLGKSDVRMAELVAECGPLVAVGQAARRAPHGLGRDAGGSASRAGSSAAPVSAHAAAFQSSLRADADALAALASRELATASGAAIDALVAACRHSRTAGAAATAAPKSVFVSGLGKSSAPAWRLAAALRSIGVRAFFVHGSEWVHGDLGGVRAGDAAVLFSHSGRTPELVDAARRLRQAGAAVFAVTGTEGSPLASAAGLHVHAPAAAELLGAVPTRSIVAQDAVANGILSAVAAAEGVSTAEFKSFHPGGAIGGRANTDSAAL